ncbi:ATPase involved in DNA repair [Yersinia intermedia]|nr:ATPase involved in DNA repair [Yersinia intermedia]
MKINKFKLSIDTDSGDYGFNCAFTDGLNIIKGNNSSGKSTLIQAIFYAFGMEELLGGEGASTMPYALRDHIVDSHLAGSRKIPIIKSSVYLEVSNGKRTITINRAIRSADYDTKLVKVIDGPYLSEPNDKYSVEYTYLHDKGSAQNKKTGFFRYLEDFLGLELPLVPDNKGGESKLYLQTIFAALFIEQKRGWTDYIANIPYYAIRNVKKRVIEFLLDCDTFANERAINTIQNEISRLHNEWSELKTEIRFISERNTLVVDGIDEKVTVDFDKDLVNIKYFKDEHFIDISKKLIELNSQIENVERAVKPTTELLINSLESEQSELTRLLSIQDVLYRDILNEKSSIYQYEINKTQILEDLNNNKIAKKLKDFGAESNLSIAKDICPTCHSPIKDSLLIMDDALEPMSITENIVYLESQLRMVKKYINGSTHIISQRERELKSVREEIIRVKGVILSSKIDIKNSDSISEKDIRIKIQAQEKIQSLTNDMESIFSLLEKMTVVSQIYKNKVCEMSKLPKSTYTSHDIKKLKDLNMSFKKLASDFGYRSAPVSDVEINYETLSPFLSGLELREIKTKEKIDLKTDSSASDFVRLIWSYLISVFIVSRNNCGNHPCVIIFDEPAQHSMGTNGFNKLLRTLASQSSLQSIVAASFDESEEVFADSTKGVNFNLIKLGGKLITSIES